MNRLEELEDYDQQLREADNITGDWLLMGFQEALLEAAPDLLRLARAVRKLIDYGLLGDEGQPGDEGYAYVVNPTEWTEMEAILMRLEGNE